MPPEMAWATVGRIGCVVGTRSVTAAGLVGGALASFGHAVRILAWANLLSHRPSPLVVRRMSRSRLAV
jgi:hypothetical protein